tara:strand:- start:355 stop:780 length:426 start_codon:yes stop_codon:yes gene_type:complete
MKIVSDSDMYISTTWGASIWLYAGEPKELGDDISLVALQQGAKEVKEGVSVSESPTILASEIGVIDEGEVEDAIVIDINDNRDREDKLKAALQQVLDEGSPSDFTTDGLPKQSVIKGVFGEQISSDERDEIWAEIIVGEEG